MQKKSKIKIIIGGFFMASLSVIFFGWRFFGKPKKIEINLENKAEMVAIIEQAEDKQENKPENNQPEETKKDAVILQEEILEKIDNNKKTELNTEIKTETKNQPAEITKLKITSRLVAWGFQKATTRKIDTIIIHSSYDAIGDKPYSVSGVIAEYKTYAVAPHYLIDREGNIYQLVSDVNIAYHAGESKMPDGRTGVNNFSLGVEMLTTKKDKLTQEQYASLKFLIANIKEKYKITAVLGHNQIAPGRKDDPWNFEWVKLK